MRGSETGAQPAPDASGHGQGLFVTVRDCVTKQLVMERDCVTQQLAMARNCADRDE